MRAQKKDTNFFQIYLFKNIDIEAVKTIFSYGEIEHYRKKSHPIIEGDPSKGIYMIISGDLMVFRHDRINDKKHKIATLKKGDAFGELSLFTDQPRIATIECETNSSLFYLSKESFNVAMEQVDPETRSAFYKIVLKP